MLNSVGERWNELPLAVSEAECRNTFKDRLDKHW